MSACSIETFVRLRPPSTTRTEKVTEYFIDRTKGDEIDECACLELKIPDDVSGGLLHNHESGILKYGFDNIFDSDAAQEDVFNAVVKDKVLGTFDGVNATVFAYGQTGSGKTYSIFGGDSFQQRGFIPRALAQVFQEIRARQTELLSFKCMISFTEVYKETLYDLLDPQKRFVPMEQWIPIQVMESGENGLVLRNINVYEVTSEESALKLFFLGNTNRITSSTAMNQKSSRSHAIFTFVVEGTGVIPSGSPAHSPSRWNGNGDPAAASSSVSTCGKLNLVDLAGSERIYKNVNTKDMISEAKAINLSLHYLEQVIINLRDRAMAHGANTHIPYRNSVLTNMLRDSLGGNCRSCFILTLSTDKKQFEESVSTCRFGQRCGEVKLTVFANKLLQSNDEVLQLQTRIKVLEQQLLAVEDDKKQRQHEMENMEFRQQQLEVQLMEQKNAMDVLVETNANALRESDKDVEVRSLSEQEHGEIAEKIHGLLAAVKESVVQQSEDILIDSQEVFYGALTGSEVDSSVLLETSMALAGLVQGMYRDRELNNARPSIATPNGTSQEGHAHPGTESVLITDTDENGQMEKLASLLDGENAIDMVHASGQIVNNGESLPVPLTVINGAQASRANVKSAKVGESSVLVEGSDIKHRSPRTHHSHQASPPPPPPRDVTSPWVEEFVKPIHSSPFSPKTNLQSKSNHVTPRSKSRNNSPKRFRSTIPELTEPLIKMLTGGASFLKFDRRGGKHLRHISLSSDCKTLKWRRISTSSTTVPVNSSISLDCFERAIVGVESRRPVPTPASLGLLWKDVKRDTNSAIEGYRPSPQRANSNSDRSTDASFSRNLSGFLHGRKR